MTNGPTPRFDDATIVRRSPDQITARIDGRVVAMSVIQGKYVGFDAVASALWDHLEEPLRVSDLCRALANDFDGDPETIRQDTVDLLARLEELELIVVGD